MIGKGKSISHGVAALEYDLAKEINGQAVATEIARHELYGCTGAEMVQEMKVLKSGKPGQAPGNLTATMSQPEAVRSIRQAR